MRLLTVNAGSSSLKLGLYELDGSERALACPQASRLGSRADEHAAALSTLLGQLPEGPIDGIGHRIVHGGPDLAEPAAITSSLVARLESLVPLAPDHLPQALATIAATRSAFPGTPQVACFDTAFHRTLPSRARLLPIPRRFLDAGVVRYGFHGLSYEYVVGELRRVDPAAAEGRLVVAHLGNGASMAAIHEGRSIDTTMGFTPAGGLMMSTRPGDLDPGVLVHLAERDGLDGAALNDLVNQRSGLLGVSGVSADVQDLLASAEPHAAEALDLFCYQARKTIGALAAALGGLDTLVFTAGIGEHAVSIRQRICDPLGHLGVVLDPGANEAGAAVVSSEASQVTIRVMATNEDLVIARHTRAVLRASAS